MPSDTKQRNPAQGRERGSLDTGHASSDAHSFIFAKRTVRLGHGWGEKVEIFEKFLEFLSAASQQAGKARNGSHLA